MANRIKFIKNVNNNSSVNNLQLLFQFIIGSDKIHKHDETKSYSKGDFVYKFDESEGEYQVFMAIDNVSPRVRLLSVDYWKRISIKDLLSSGDMALGKSADIIKISNEQPTELNNDIWYKPLKYKSFGGVDKEDVTLIFDCEHIVGQDDEPEDPDVRLWFDYEFDHEGNPIILSENDEDEEEVEENVEGIILDGGLDMLLDDFGDF